MISGFVAMEKALLAKYLVPLLNLVEHACSVGMLGKVKGGGGECGLVKYKRYIPEDGHWLKLGFDWQDWSGSCSCGLPGMCSRR